MNRRGSGLVEAVVASALTALLVVAALGALSSMQRSTGRFLSRSLGDQVVRGATQLLRSELRDIAPSAGDLISYTSASVTYRAVRATGIACAVVAGRLQVRAGSWRPWRQPAAGRDSLVLLGQPADTQVVVAALAPPTTGVCPDGVASVSLPYVLGTPDPVAFAHYPAPLLMSEVMEIRAYESSGEWWLGVRSVSAGEVIQPAHGPIAANGLRVVALDSVGAPTVTPERVSHFLFVVKLPSGDSTVVALDLSRAALR